MAAKSSKRLAVAGFAGLLAALPAAQTPKLNIRTAHHGPMEEQRRDQMLRLAAQYDLKKYTITRDLVIEHGRHQSFLSRADFESAVFG